MKFPTRLLAPLALGVIAVAAQAQDNVVKLGISRYTTHSKSNGVTGPGIPAGADAETGDATTVIFTGEHLFTPQVGLEFVLGVPPKIKTHATGSVAFLGDVLEAKNVSPTFFVNYHFGQPGDTWRPYLGLGANYTKFVGIKSPLAQQISLSDGWGWAAQAGIEYAVNPQWSLFASVAALRTRTDLVAVGATVIQTSIDLRPVVYTAGVAFKF